MARSWNRSAIFAGRLTLRLLLPVLGIAALLAPTKVLMEWSHVQGQAVASIKTLLQETTGKQADEAAAEDEQEEDAPEEMAEGTILTAEETAPKNVTAGTNRRRRQSSVVDSIVKRVAGTMRPLTRCALVGSSAILVNASLGTEIDSHDVVIRVNRIPTKEYIRDYGSRTDILFQKRIMKNKLMYTQLGVYYWLFGSKVCYCSCKTGRVSECSVDNGKGSRCPFKAVMFKAPREEGQWYEHPVCMVKIARQTTTASRFVGALLRAFAKYGDYRRTSQLPTNGFEAFVIAGLVCDSLDVYGFGGATTGDKHRISKNHHLELEHDFINRTAAGNLEKFSIDDQDLQGLLQKLLTNEYRINLGQSR